jgi:WD40 repeat protein
MRFFLLCFSVLCLAVVSTTAQVRIVAPAAGEPVLIDSVVTIRWQGAEGRSVSLWYSADKGATWNRIARGITASEYDWSVPDLPTDSLMFRIELLAGGSPIPLRKFADAHVGEIRSAMFSYDGRLILSAGRDSWIKVREIATGKTLDSVVIPNGGEVYAARFTGSGDTVFVHQLAEVWRWDRKNRVFSSMPVGSSTDSIRALDVHPKRPLLATAGAASIVRIRNSETGVLLRTLSYAPSAVLYTVSFSSDGSKVLFAGDNGVVNIWDWEGTGELRSFRQHGSGALNLVVWDCDFAPGDSLFASGGVDATARLWKQDTPDARYIFRHNSHVRSVGFSPDGRRILSGSLDSTIRQWDVEHGEQIGDSLNHGGQVICSEYSPTGDTMMSAGRDGAIVLWKSGVLDVSRDTATYKLGHEIVLEIPHLSGPAGAGLYVPLLWRDRPVSPEFLAATGTVAIEIPAVLLETVPGGNVLERRRGTLRDTVLLPIRVNIPGDTIAVIPARILLGVPTRQDIRFLDVAWQPENRLVARTVDGSITVVDSCHLEQVRSVGFSQESGLLSVAPNPASSEVTIGFVLATDEKPELTVYSTQGEKVLTLGDVPSGAGEHAVRCKVGQLSAGEYFIQLRTATRRYTARFTVVR